MTEHVDNDELPGLTDNDVRLLYSICERASRSDDPPFKSLFTAYDAIFDDQQLGKEHDGVIFRYLMRIGEGTRSANLESRTVDLLERLKELLEAQGITILSNADDGVEDVTVDTSGSPRKIEGKVPTKQRRRVSFDDARLEETWLSERLSSLAVSPAKRPSHGLFSQPSRRSSDGPPAPRARSTSSQRGSANQRNVFRYLEHTSHSTTPTSHWGHDDQLNPTLIFEPSQTQLELNAEAFLSTSDLRFARRALNTWSEKLIHLQQSQSRADSIAAAHDRRILIKQALDAWRSSFGDRYEDKRKKANFERLEARAEHLRGCFIKTKAFGTWAAKSIHGKLKTAVAQRYVLQVTYFERWRAIAAENQAKTRSLLCRKYIALWRDRTTRRLLREEQAAAHYEEHLLKRSKERWFWAMCERRVDWRHQEWIKRKALKGLVKRLSTHWQMRQFAEDTYKMHVVKKTMQGLGGRLRERQQVLITAQIHQHHTITNRYFQNLQVYARLRPLGRTVTLRLDLDVQRKVFRFWHRNASLFRQAKDVNRKRILQSAWTGWNDALRCKALAQRIDERVLLESVYKWVLQERLQMFQSTINGRLVARVLAYWRSRAGEVTDRLAWAEQVFDQGQQRRRMLFAMTNLHMAMRNREDAERAAMELANSNVIPKVLAVWKEKTDQSRRLAKWAADARYYCLCSPALKVWKEKTNEHKHIRRRDAYASVRARVKIRIVGHCFGRWRSKCMEVYSMDGEAEQRAQTRLGNIAARAFSQCREVTAQHARLHSHAAILDQQKLLVSVTSAISNRYTHLTATDQQAADFRYETDLALLATALKKIQWATFTAARRAESADALWARNRDQHIKQMLRHWMSQIASRQADRHARDRDTGDVAEPESPSLRPASRAAASRTTLPSSPPALQSTTPGYMRTPSRSRRAGRFRPLPTPAPFTPLAFNSAYLVTNPMPLSTAPELAERSPALPIDPFNGMEALTPQVTPFQRKLRAGGFTPLPPSGPRSSLHWGQPNTGTNKSVRFAGPSRLGGSYVRDS